MSSIQRISCSRVIAAEANVIFDLIADPDQHSLFDGSDTVVSSNAGNPDRLELGSRFRMGMKFGVPYWMTNEVVEFCEGELIAWRHFAHHIWRYELEPADEGKTLVTESFDWGAARVPRFYEMVGYPARHKSNIERTLERLQRVVEGNTLQSY